jgi:hypothetical protein
MRYLRIPYARAGAAQIRAVAHDAASQKEGTMSFCRPQEPVAAPLLTEVQFLRQVIAVGAGAC